MRFRCNLVLREGVLCILVLFILNVFTLVRSEEDEIIEASPAVAPALVSSPVIFLRTKRQLPFLANWWNSGGQKSKIELSPSSLPQQRYGNYAATKRYSNRTGGMMVETGNGLSERDARCKFWNWNFMQIHRFFLSFIIKLVPIC